jgi:bifunctional DNase/RNase
MQIEMMIRTLTTDPITNMPIVVLRESTPPEGEDPRMLPIWVGLNEANAILLQLENVVTPRPMTHDLLKSVIADLNGKVERVVVCDLKENTFYARIDIRAPQGTVTIDARPSDAIALSLRTGSPVFVEESVIQTARGVDTENESVDVGRLQTWLEGLTDDELGKYKM